MATFGQDPSLALIANFVESFRQAKALQFQKELILRREDRYDTQLQENRLHRQRQLTISQAHLGLAERREERFAGQPRAKTVEFYTSRGYSPEQSQRLLDIEVGASPKPRRPIEDIRDGRIIMENALTDQQYSAGESILQDAMERLSSQQTDVSGNIPPATFGRGTTPTRTTPSTGVFQGPQTETDAGGAVFGGGTTQPEPPDFDRIEQELGAENAQMEQKAWGVIYDAWDHFSRELQDKIRLAEQNGKSFTEITQTDEVNKLLQELIK